MHNFTAHRLRFATEVQRTIELNEHQGSAIRGALFHALRNRFCGNREAAECAACPLVATCPVATLAVGNQRIGESAKEDWMTSVASIEERLSRLPGQKDFVPGHWCENYRVPVPVLQWVRRAGELTSEA